ncbi:hypothetical protein EV44_g4183 [Erysiphe necator]|uniref:Uncharacterized protein n=1 Tax=Uncinula necator TaxID=52586 RepID=A0A0B1NY94_UNCNE|nr:hypothetical protein EV44_g4183 [Erysiphe necator]
MAFRFVDDTNLVAWGRSARENCYTLELAHSKFLAWAKRYGAEFAPEIYQLIHFSRKRGSSEDLKEKIELEDITINPRSEIKVLGVLVDSRLRWGPQLANAAQKGEVAFNAQSRITSSVWGPSVRSSRLLYTAIVRPTMLYGSQVWGIRPNGGYLKVIMHSFI